MLWNDSKSSTRLWGEIPMYYSDSEASFPPFTKSYLTSYLLNSHRQATKIVNILENSDSNYSTCSLSPSRMESACITTISKPHFPPPRSLYWSIFRNNFASFSPSSTSPEMLALFKSSIAPHLKECYFDCSFKLRLAYSLLSAKIY